jgi:ethanolamine utilization protein EutJ
MGEFHDVLHAPRPADPGALLKIGLDLGTANTVLVVLDSEDRPLTAQIESGSFVRDGVVVDFAGAIDAVRRLKSAAEDAVGVSHGHAPGAIPPGVPEGDARAVRHVIEAAGMECSGLLDEPTAANALLRLRDGVVIDVGGGSTGVSVLKDGEVALVADEPTGGTHFSLVLAGALGISFEEADKLKRQVDRQHEFFPILAPVMERVGAIVARHAAPFGRLPASLVGGPAMFPGFAEVVSRYANLDTTVPDHPLFVTPLGIARCAPTLPATPSF